MPRKKKEKTMEDIIECIRDDLDLLEQKIIDIQDDVDDFDNEDDDLDDDEEDE